MMISDIVIANDSSNKISEFFEDFPVNVKKKKKRCNSTNKQDFIIGEKPFWLKYNPGNTKQTRTKR